MRAGSRDIEVRYQTEYQPEKTRARADSSSPPKIFNVTNLIKTEKTRALRATNIIGTFVVLKLDKEN